MWYEQLRRATATPMDNRWPIMPMETSVTLSLHHLIVLLDRSSIRWKSQNSNSTYKEADTRMYLHAAYAARTDPGGIIVCPDTDVLVIKVSLQPLVKAHLYFQTGKSANLRNINVIHSCVGEGFSKALIGLRCFTGCDSVSAFHRKEEGFRLAHGRRDIVCIIFEIYIGVVWPASRRRLSSWSSFYAE